MNFISSIKNESCFYSRLDYFIYLLLLIYVFVDCLTGFTKIYGGPSPAIPYKFILMFFMTVSIGVKSRISIDSRLSFLLIIYFYMITLICLIVYSFGYYSVVSDSLSMILRIIFTPIIYIYIIEIYLKENIPNIYIEKIVRINFLCFCFNEMLGLLGYGVSTYSDGGFGTKGFYYDGNALAVMIFCMYVYYYIMEQKKRKMMTIFFLFLAILIGTKTAILSIVLYIVIVSVLKLDTIKKILYLILIFCLIAIVFYVCYINHIFDYHIEKMQRFYILFKGNIISMLFSGRNIDLVHHFGFYKDNFNLKQFFFGHGYLSHMKIIELDLFDTLFSYGIFIFLPVLFFYYYVYYINKKNKKIVAFNLLYFLISITAGHVWFNTSSALFYGIINTYIVSMDNLNEKNILYQ
jgi:hypothetical protein